MCLKMSFRFFFYEKSMTFVKFSFEKHTCLDRLTAK